MEPRSRERGNGEDSERKVKMLKLQWSRAQESAEIPSEQAAVANRDLASMEPRSRERGNSTGHQAKNERSCSFNGAALKRARKCAARPWGPPWEACFNGAALKRARKCPGCLASCAGTARLQWSRAQESAEIPPAAVLPPIN